MLILRKYSNDFISDAYEFKEELFINMMISISSFDLTLSLFYFDEEMFVKLRNELKSNFRSLDISWGQCLGNKSRTFSYREDLIRSKLDITFYSWKMYDFFTMTITRNCIIRLSEHKHNESRSGQNSFLTNIIVGKFRYLFLKFKIW